MLVFECPSCGAKLQASEESAGKKIVCPKCQTKAPVPASEALDAEAITAEPSAKPARSSAVTTAENARPAGRGPRRDDDDDAQPAKAKTGMGIGMILLIVFGLGFCCVLAPMLTAIGLLVPAVSKVRVAAERAQASNNAKQIGLAAHSHHDAMQTFPPPRMPNGDLSWRVTILPFVEQNNLFNLFDQTQAWNGPANAGFVTMMPPVYQGPDLSVPEFSKTRFQYFTGPNTMFPMPLSKITVAQITDGTSNTLLFAEALTPVEWTKPADMAIAPNGPLPLPQDKFLAAFCDGSVRFIDRHRADDNVLRLLINPKDGQMIPAGALD